MANPVTNTIRSNLPLLKQAFCSLGTKNEKIALVVGGLFALGYGWSQGTKAQKKLRAAKWETLYYVPSKITDPITQILNTTAETVKITIHLDEHTITSDKVHIVPQNNIYAPKLDFTCTGKKGYINCSKTLSINVPRQLYKKIKKYYPYAKTKTFSNGKKFLVLKKKI